MLDKKFISNLNDLQSVLNKFGPGDIRLVNKRVRDWNKEMQAQAASKFDEGDKVFFISKHGFKIIGTIISIKPKRIKMQADTTGMIWRVSPSLLEKEKGKNAK